MLAALISIVVVIAALGYNLHRVYRCIDQDYGSGPLAGWIIGFPMAVAASVATAVVYVVFWHGQGLTYDQTAHRVMFTWLGLIFVPLVLGLVLSIVLAHRAMKRAEKYARSLYSDNEH